MSRLTEYLFATFQEGPEPDWDDPFGGGGGDNEITEADLNRQFKQRVITEEEYRAALRQIGKTEPSIEALVRANRPSQASITPPQLEGGAGLAALESRQFPDGWYVTDAQGNKLAGPYRTDAIAENVVAQMEEQGLRGEQVTGAGVGTEAEEPRSRFKNLTKAQLDAAVADGRLSPEEYAEELRARKFSDEEIQFNLGEIESKAKVKAPQWGVSPADQAAGAFKGLTATDTAPGIEPYYPRTPELDFGAQGYELAPAPGGVWDAYPSVTEYGGVGLPNRIGMRPGDTMAALGLNPKNATEAAALTLAFKQYSDMRQSQGATAYEAALEFTNQWGEAYSPLAPYNTGVEGYGAPQNQPPQWQPFEGPGDAAYNTTPQAIPMYATGGTRTLLPERTWLMGDSGSIYGVAAEAGKQELAETLPSGGFRFEPTTQDITMGRESPQPMPLPNAAPVGDYTSPYLAVGRESPAPMPLPGGNTPAPLAGQRPTSSGWAGVPFRPYSPGYRVGTAPQSEPLPAAPAPAPLAGRSPTSSGYAGAPFRPRTPGYAVGTTPPGAAPPTGSPQPMPLPNASPITGGRSSPYITNALANLDRLRNRQPSAPSPAPQRSAMPEWLRSWLGGTYNTPRERLAALWQYNPALSRIARFQDGGEAIPATEYYNPEDLEPEPVSYSGQDAVNRQTALSIAQKGYQPGGYITNIESNLNKVATYAPELLNQYASQIPISTWGNIGLTRDGSGNFHYSPTSNYTHALATSKGSSYGARVAENPNYVEGQDPATMTAAQHRQAALSQSGSGAVAGSLSGLSGGGGTGGGLTGAEQNYYDAQRDLLNLQREHLQMSEAEFQRWQAALNDIAGNADAAQRQTTRNMYNYRYAMTGVPLPEEVYQALDQPYDPNAKLGAPGARYAIEAPAERVKREIEIAEMQRRFEEQGLRLTVEEAQMLAAMERAALSGSSGGSSSGSRSSSGSTSGPVPIGQRSSTGQAIPQVQPTFYQESGAPEGYNYDAAGELYSVDLPGSMGPVDRSWLTATLRARGIAVNDSMSLKQLLQMYSDSNKYYGYTQVLDLSGMPA